MAGRVAPWRRGGTSVTIRDAAPADAEAVCRIENQGIEDRVATLETELRTPAERREWMASRGPRHPVLVAEIDGAITGWGFGAPRETRGAPRCGRLAYSQTAGSSASLTPKRSATVS